MERLYCDAGSILQKDPQGLDRILQRMKENTRTECINIKTKISDKQLPTTCSKLGGLPYWPKSRLRPYPHTKGKLKLPLTMLAQINLSDLPENDVFPDSGMLQFFILNGIDTDSYEVVFHRQIEEPIIFTRSGPVIPYSLMPTEIEINTERGRRVVPNIFWGEAGFPLTGEFALEFSKIYDFVNPTENCFETEFIRAAKQLGIPISDDFEVYSGLSDGIYDEFYERGCGHKLLGHPCFVQNDYREGEDENDILLFQIDSAWQDSGETDGAHFINLGDAGTAGFFIKKEDLKKLDFSSVFYDWACG